MLTREQVKRKWMEIIESIHKHEVFSSVEGAWRLAQWVESQDERGDRLEATIDRMAGTIVDLRMALATVEEIYRQEGLTHYTTESGEQEINPAYSVICNALRQSGGLTKKAEEFFE